MNGFQRVLLLVVCGGLMALAALAGQIGYGDDYGRNMFTPGSLNASAPSQLQAEGLTKLRQSPAGEIKL